MPDPAARHPAATGVKPDQPAPENATNPTETSPTKPDADKTEPKPSDTPIPPDTLAVLGETVHASDGTEIGRIVDVVVGARGQPVSAVIDGGGFLGVGSRKMALDWPALHFAPASTNAISTDLTADQIRSAPEYKPPATAQDAAPATPSAEQTPTTPAADTAPHKSSPTVSDVPAPSPSPASPAIRPAHPVPEQIAPAVPPADKDGVVDRVPATPPAPGASPPSH